MMRAGHLEMGFVRLRLAAAVVTNTEIIGLELVSLLPRKP